VIKRKYVVIGFLALCLTVTLLLSVTITSSENVYDPWADINGDGFVNVVDLGLMSDAWLTEGNPIPRQGNISIPAAAFVSSVSNDNTYIWDRLMNYEDSITVYFVASVQLPHGATVTNMTSYWKDEGGNVLSCHLMRYNQTQTEFMASTSSSTTTGYGSGYDDTVDFATIDNNQYAYFL